MGAASVSLGSKRFEALAARLVESGRYASISEVFEAAAEALDRQECEDDAKEAYLREAIEEGEASGIAEGDVFARVRERAGLPPRVRA
jgi:putative addiction module CopG family antidote